MSQQTFQDRHYKVWQDVSDKLDLLDRGKMITAGGEKFPEQYRELCQHLALARHRRYGADLVEGLNRMVLKGHQHLYRRRFLTLRKVLDFITADFPRQVRKDWKLLLIAILLFFGVGAASDYAIHSQPELAYTILGPQMVHSLEVMYDPNSSHHLRPRESESDLFMFGFYIRNNTGIGFRTFASGLLLGIGSIFFLVFNGLMLGGAAGYIDHIGYGQTFYPFVVGHGSFELVAIVLSGQAGMKLGFTVLMPGRRTRIRALVEEGKKSMIIVFGFMAMFFIAAFIEAFWSSSVTIPAQVKYAVGAVLWLFVISYFLFAGRGRAAR